MGGDYDDAKLDELLRLTKENNRILRSMRRSAFLGGLVKFAMWAAFILVPLWFYMHYIAPVMQSMLETMEQVQGARSGVEAQFSGLNDALQGLRERFPQYFQGN